MKKLMIIGALLMTSQLFAQEALGEVIGTIMEQSTGETAYNAVAFIETGGTKYQARADEDGKFRISAIPAGSYYLKIRHKGDTMVQDFLVEVPMDGFYPLGTVDFVSSTQVLDVMQATYVRDAIRLIDGNLPVKSMSAKEIDKSPLKFDVKGLISSMSSDVKLTDDGDLVFRGARKGDMLYLVDGVKTASVGAVPGCSIGRLMVYTGGLPAKYGDTLGGVVVMESKSYFDLYRVWEGEQIRAGKK